MAERTDEKLKLISDTDFREVYHHFVYIECKEIINDIIKGDVTDEDTGVCAYGYIDDDAGLSLSVFQLATYKDGKLTTRDLPGNVAMWIFRYHAKYLKNINNFDQGKVIMSTLIPDEHYIGDMKELGADLAPFAGIEKTIRENYDNPSHDKEELRTEKYSYLDPFRYPACPDEVLVMLFSKNNEPERAWVRCMFAAENEVFGTLLTEPKADYKIHKGDMIGFVLYEEGEEKMLVATGHTARTITQ